MKNPARGVADLRAASRASRSPLLELEQEDVGVGRGDRWLERSPVTLILGPRQCGKTTLARSWVKKREHYYDLESPRDFGRWRSRKRAGAREGWCAG